MKIINKKLNNNLNLKFIKTEKFKLVNTQFSFSFELNYDDIAAYNLLLNLLITRNNSYSNMSSFNSFLENNYGMIVTGAYFNRGNVAVFNINSRAINSKYTINEDMLKQQIETVLECLFNPVFTNEALEEIKMIYIEKLKDKLNKKTYILKKKVNELLGVNTPYGVNMESNIADISKVDLNKIKEVYKKLLNSNCSIYVCGDLNEEDLIEKFKKLKLLSNDNSILNLDYIKDIKKQENKVFESKFLQSAISLIYQCDIKYNDRLYYPLKIFIEMLNYDIFNIIREKYNYCYYIYAIKNNYLNTIEIVSEIESKNLENIIRLIDEIIIGYQKEFDEQRFELAKNKILTYIKNSLDDPRDLIDLHFGFDFNKTISSIEDLEKTYLQVNKQDIIEVSKNVSLRLVSILKEGK